MLKIFNFPHLVQEEIVKEMEGPDIISLFFCSARAKTLIRCVKFQHVETVVDCRKMETTTRIRCLHKNHPEKEVTVNIGRADTVNGIISIIIINTVRFDISCIDRELETKPEHSRSLHRAILFGRTCVLFLQDVFGSFLDLTIRLNTKRKFETFGEQEISCDYKYRKYTAQKFKLDSELSSHIHDFERVFPPTLPVLPATVFLSNVARIATRTESLSITSLLQFDGFTAIFMNTIFDTMDFIRVIMDWFEGNKPNLISFVLWQKEKNSIDRESLLNHIETTTWDPEQRERSFFGFPELKRYFTNGENLLDCIDGSDIVRPDGKRCTFKIWERTAFCFYIWEKGFQ